MRVGPVTDIAVEIFRDRDLGRQRAPALRDLDVFLFENDLAAIVRDLGGATLPFNLIEWLHRRIAENALEMQAWALPLRGGAFAAIRRFPRVVQRCCRDSGFKLNHTS